MIDKENDSQDYRLQVFFGDRIYVGRGLIGQTLLENIEAMGVAIPNSCRRGLCGSCRVQLLNGKLSSEHRLTDEGEVLSCASKLISDADIKITPRRSSCRNDLLYAN